MSEIEEADREREKARLVYIVAATMQGSAADADLVQLCVQRFHER